MERVMIPAPTDIKKAAEKIQRYIHKTPVFTSEIINRKLNMSLYFKC